MGMLQFKAFHFTVVLVGLIVGIMLTVQFRMAKNIEKNPQIQQTQALVSQVNQSREERAALEEELNKLRSKLDQVAAGPQLGELRKELRGVQIEAGLLPVTGPGVEVSLNDSNVVVQPGENPNLYVLHDEDVLKVINELKAAGAEAISINGQRLLATSEIRCIGPTILINKNHRLTPPFIVSAIGDQDNMVNSLQMRGGIIEQLKFWGIQVSVRKVSQLTIPAYTGGIRFDYAKPVE